MKVKGKRRDMLEALKDGKPHMALRWTASGWLGWRKLLRDGHIRVTVAHGVRNAAGFDGVDAFQITEEGLKALKEKRTIGG